MTDGRTASARATVIAAFSIVALLTSFGCRGPGATHEQTSRPSTQSGSASTAAAPADTSPSLDGGASSLDGLFGRSGDRPVPKDLIIGGDCPPLGADADQEIAAQATARVPLKEGLTISELWNPTAEQEYECLTQVTKIDRDGIEISVSCNAPDRPQTIRRRICRADLRAARMLHTALGGVTIVSAAGDLPETIVGATEFSVSADQFAELKKSGSMRDHYVQVGSLESLDIESEGVLHAEGAGQMSVIVNNQPVDVPVVRASGAADMWRFGKAQKGVVKAAILDDERFPMLIDYRHSVDPTAKDDFTIHPSKITYPNEGDLEDQLARKKRLVVYGIYFDFASDRIRVESEPILKEIAQALAKNPDWRVRIEGHTDGIGGAASNLDLSRRRSAAVRQALLERYHVADSRLTTSGFGMSVPIDTNDTPEGRAKNRRVELIREE